MVKSERKYYAYSVLNEIKKKGFIKAERPEELKKDIQRFYNVNLKINNQKLSLL